MKIVYLLLITISLLSANAHSLYQKIYWKKLLHVENDKSSVTSDEFFLSTRYNFSLKKELKTTLKLLRGSEGKAIACNFPARYSWIKKHTNVPNYDLKSCKELSHFMDTFQKENLYLVFSSEYPNSPSSSFGHTMIAFKNNNIPLEVSDVIHFAAQTDNEDFFTYSYKGLTGKFNSYFLRTSFFQKIYSYNIKEQRYIYAYKLNFSKEEIQTIQYHLFELRKATFGYYFLNQNCASMLVDLLEISNENQPPKKMLFHLPIDTIKFYQNRIQKITKLSPLISKINYLIHKMSKREKRDFLNIIKNNSIPSENLSNITKETLVYYYKFLFRKYHQSYSNYQNVMQLTYKKSYIEDKSQNPLKNTQPSKVGIAYSTKTLELNYMPLFIKYQDIQKNPMQEVEFKLININLHLQEKNLSLENIDLVKVKSLPKQYSFYHPISWAFYFGFNHENHDNKLKFENSYGIGLTKELIPNISTSFLLNTGFNLSRDGINAYLSPSFLISTYLDDDLKLGIESQYKYYFSKEYYKHEFFITHKIDKFNLSLKYQNESFDKKYSVGINYNY